MNLKPMHSRKPPGVRLKSLLPTDIVRSWIFSKRDARVEHRFLIRATKGYNRKRGDAETVKILLDSGVPVDYVEEAEGNALQAAAFCGNLDVMELLLSRKADVKLECPPWTSAIYAAVVGGNASAVERLVRAGASLGYVQQQLYGNALQAASYYGNKKMVKTLLEGGALVNALGGKYGTALCAAAEVGHFGVVKMLLDGGADPNTPRKTSYGSALRIALRRHHTEVAELLRQKGAKK